METAQGTASHCQNTSRVSGGGNGAVSTTYIALFRLDRRQVQFSSGAPLSISDGDQVVVAGRSWRGALYADAVRNVTTGLTKHSGIVSRVILALILLAIGSALSWFLTKSFGVYGVLAFLAFLAGCVYLLLRAAQTNNALRYVKSAPL